MSVDPSHYLSAANGGKPPPLLKLQNITARPELNGQFGQAIAFQAGRYLVALHAGAQPAMLKLKPENLTEAGSVDQLKFGAGMLFKTAKEHVDGPAVREWGERIAERLPPAARGRVTPERALAGAAIAVLSMVFSVFFVVGRFVGFTRLFVVVSLVALMLAVSSPDWMEGYKARKPFKLVAQGAARNFTRRWKDNLVNMTGYDNISDKMALVSLVAVLLFSGKVLMTPPPQSRPPQMPNMPMGGNTMNMQTTSPHVAPKYDLEYIYKLGFDDAKSNNEFGTSLPEDIIEYNAAQESNVPPADQYNDGNNDNFDWAYNPPPPPPPQSKSTLGMGTMLSLFTLYRFGKDVVTGPDGSLVLDPQYVMAKLRSIETWRLGMMGMSLYRVVTALISLAR